MSTRVRLLTVSIELPTLKLVLVGLESSSAYNMMESQALFWQPENEFKNVEILKNKTRLRVLHLTNRPEGTACKMIMVLPCQIQSPYSVHIARYLSCLVNGDSCHLPPSRCTCRPLIFAWRPHCLHGSPWRVQKRLDRRVEESRALTPEWKCRTPRPTIKAISYRLKSTLETLFKLIWLFGGSASFWTRCIGLIEVLSNNIIYRVMFVPVFINI